MPFIKDNFKIPMDSFFINNYKLVHDLLIVA